MRKPAKDCDNCKFDVLDCGCNPFRDIDKRQVRKLKRTANYIMWERFYCKKHKYAK